MSITILRTADAWWVRTPSGAARIDTDATTTGELLAEPEQIEAARASKDDRRPGHPRPGLPGDGPLPGGGADDQLRQPRQGLGLQPGHHPADLLPQDVGLDQRPFDDIVRPGHVRYLDYEVEIGLVIGRELPVGTQVTEENWTSFVAGLVVTNDVSARDVQLPKTQFFESKSYPTFTPVGPALVLLDDDELKRFGDLRLRLWVNGELRQDAVVDGDMIYSPLEALQALSRFQRLDAGDLLLTGTPEGTALSAPPKPVEIIAAFLPPALKWKLFFQRQAQNPKYLKHGDVVEVAIGTDDGAIDLGRQRTVVRSA